MEDNTDPFLDDDEADDYDSELTDDDLDLEDDEEDKETE